MRDCLATPQYYAYIISIQPRITSYLPVFDCIHCIQVIQICEFMCQIAFNHNQVFYYIMVAGNGCEEKIPCFGFQNILRPEKLDLSPNFAAEFDHIKAAVCNYICVISVALQTKFTKKYNTVSSIQIPIPATLQYIFTSTARLNPVSLL